MPPTEVANAERFERFGLDADAEAVSRARCDFTQWLEHFFTVDDIRRSDIVLAINEGLANSAEFAYLLADRPGTIDIRAVHDLDTQSLTVCIDDRGLWCQRQADRPRTRGRGIPLMKALSDGAAIEATSGGTSVRLVWRGVHRL